MCPGAPPGIMVASIANGDGAVSGAKGCVPMGAFQDATLGAMRGVGLPASWRFCLLSLGAMLALAGLDFLGAIFAKEFAERQHAGMFLAGLLTFGVLFGVYAASLKVAELSFVTFGWVVFLQVGLLLLDRLRYDVPISTGKWLAMAAILALQTYLILAPNPSAAGN